ncbi:hypothetical protein OH77DRAFT_814145 [Trametes cingulata]|nr:hypothetical protein OH77DRAFT_814145 [Trametes cingulata]
MPAGPPAQVDRSPVHLSSPAMTQPEDAVLLSAPSSPQLITFSPECNPPLLEPLSSGAGVRATGSVVSMVPDTSRPTEVPSQLNNNSSWDEHGVSGPPQVVQADDADGAIPRTLSPAIQSSLKELNLHVSSRNTRTTLTSTSSHLAGASTWLRGANATSPTPSQDDVPTSEGLSQMLKGPEASGASSQAILFTPLAPQPVSAAIDRHSPLVRRILESTRRLPQVASNSPLGPPQMQTQAPQNSPAAPPEARNSGSSRISPARPPLAGLTVSQHIRQGGPYRNAPSHSVRVAPYKREVATIGKEPSFCVDPQPATAHPQEPESFTLGPWVAATLTGAFQGPARPPPSSGQRHDHVVEPLRRDTPMSYDRSCQAKEGDLNGSGSEPLPPSSSSLHAVAVARSHQVHPGHHLPGGVHTGMGNITSNMWHTSQSQQLEQVSGCEIPTNRPDSTSSTRRPPETYRVPTPMFEGEDVPALLQEAPEVGICEFLGV